MSSFPFEQEMIQSVTWAWGLRTHKVGVDGLTRIEMQEVPGNGAMVPWFICWRGDQLVAAINALHVESVNYV